MILKIPPIPKLPFRLNNNHLVIVKQTIDKLKSDGFGCISIALSECQNSEEFSKEVREIFELAWEAFDDGNVFEDIYEELNSEITPKDMHTIRVKWLELLYLKIKLLQE